MYVKVHKKSVLVVESHPTARTHNSGRHARCELINWIICRVVAQAGAARTGTLFVAADVMREQIKSQHFTSGAAASTSLATVATFYIESCSAISHLIYYIIVQKTYLIRALFCADVSRISNLALVALRLRLRRAAEHSDAALDYGRDSLVFIVPN